MEEFLQNYEKQYRKTARLYIGLKITVVALLIGYMVTSIFYESSISTLMLWSAVILTFGNRKIAQAFSDNVNTIVFKWTDDMDVAFAFDVFEKLLQNKKRKDYAFVLSAYLNLLVIMCRFEEFDDIYLENQNVVQKSLYRIMPFYYEMFTGMMKDRSEFRDIVSKRKVSKYYNVEGKLSKKAQALRKRDEQYTVQKMYEMGEYAQLLEYLEKVHEAAKYDHILYDTYRQSCLYQLNPGYEIVIPDVPDLYCIRTLKYLKETGEMYSLDKAKEFAERCKADSEAGIKLRNRKIMIVCIGMFIVLFIMFICFSLMI